ncbi:hypothetical protein [Rheinheimera nanhaiensis]|uniref:Uncharacterized protein n=1 Tax=Rheinheimera nanhaiensis E407-8 TaxID=562729 RepID=I1DW43_9GAMM|nr:hypothetical protein [Rheinheimera nanhaiensis]GAB58271.1 hypothetical protein RNAN_1242 [Rheinheimera nanhaiensis E407-8]
MKKLLIYTLLISASPYAFSQTPLSSRLYLDSQDNVIRYEANIHSYGLKGKSSASELLSTLGITTACTKDKCAQASDKIPQGFGNLSLTSFSGGAEAQINLIRYNLHYSAHGYLPLYLIVNASTDASFNLDTLNNSLLGTDTGLVNFKIADDTYTFNQDDGHGICDFKGSGSSANNLHGGCYINLQAGVKLLNYQNELEVDKRMAAFYSSAQFAFEFPITESTEIKKAGRLVGTLGLSGYYANTAKASSLFPELVENEDKLDKAYASFDAGFNLVIDEQFSITAKFSHPLNNKELLDSVTSVSFTWAPK